MSLTQLGKTSDMKTLPLRIALVLGLIVGLHLVTIPNSVAETVKPQGEIIPFDADKWNFIGNTKIVDHQGKKAIKLGVRPEGKPFGFGAAMVKGASFTNGIIEYDVSFGQTRTFAGIRFRAQKPGNFENFYMRPHQSGNPDANQYVPVYNRASAWQLYYGPQYSAATKYKFNKWMHIKLVVSGKLADIYIDDMSKPAVTIALKRDVKSGGVGLWGVSVGGPAYFANFSVKPMDNVDIVGTPVPEIPAKNGTVMSWQVSNSFDRNSVDGSAMLSKDMIASLSYKALAAGKTGMTNLARVQGTAKGKESVFAKVTIKSEFDQTKKFEFGFSDMATVYLNGQPMFSGSDRFRSRDYRFLGTVGYNDAVYLPLKKGDNELQIMVTEIIGDVGGWAVQGRFENMDGLSVQ